MNTTELAAKLDATNLKLDADYKDIEMLCDEAKEANYAAVCVYPSYLSLCSDRLKGTEVNICTVVGFPHGCSSIESKQEEIMHARTNGASEVDIVMHHAALRAGDDKLVSDEINRLCKSARQANLVSKVIVETCYLNEAQKLTALHICEQAGADFIKTSTGFGSGGATIEDVKLFDTNRTTAIKIKASGGIRTLDKALALIHAGAERLGVSAANDLLREFSSQT